MGHDRCDRREFLRKAGLTTGVLGLSLLGDRFLREAYGVTPSANLKRYDAIIQIFYDGAPSQTDTWDPKPGSPNNVFNTIDLGAQDIYGQRIRISEVFPNLASLVTSDAAIGLGIVRSMSHNNGDHDTAQHWMNCFWQTPAAALYPSTAAVMAHYHKDQTGTLKMPSVLIRGSNGARANDAKGSECPTAMQVFDLNSTVQMLRSPSGVDAARASRRRQLIEAFNGSYVPTRPDDELRAWDEAWRQAYDVTQSGQAAAAFDLTGKPTLPGGSGASGTTLRNLTLAQELVKAGVPYVALGIGGNDSHTNNIATVQRSWGASTDVPVAEMARNLKATGKRVLVVMGGEFGRTPDTVRPDASGNRRDGRDHWGSGFSWAMLSINQPSFRTTAVGNTGPDGMWTSRSSTRLVDAVQPSAFGAFLYRSMGYAVGSDPATNIRVQTGVRSPVDQALATQATPGGGVWLSQQFFSS
ncbi:MAG: DUF1501 domain-containing protein [Planctomycetes bacterium]|nr:DUF1501 domain-containing protein [Planctomycetota bacterium]